MATFLLPEAPITSLDAYLATDDGGGGVRRAQEIGPMATIDTVLRSGLRGRGVDLRQQKGDFEQDQDSSIPSSTVEDEVEPGEERVEPDEEGVEGDQERGDLVCDTCSKEFSGDIEDAFETNPSSRWVTTASGACGRRWRGCRMGSGASRT